MQAMVHEEGLEEGAPKLPSLPMHAHSHSNSTHTPHLRALSALLSPHSSQADPSMLRRLTHTLCLCCCNSDASSDHACIAAFSSFSSSHMDDQTMHRDMHPTWPLRACTTHPAIWCILDSSSLAKLAHRCSHVTLSICPLAQPVIHYGTVLYVQINKHKHIHLPLPQNTTEPSSNSIYFTFPWARIPAELHKT
jgi:hypothetical protein